jgi:hypothetical protein
MYQVVLRESGTNKFLAEVEYSKGKLWAGQQTEIYDSPSGLGYRGDRICDYLISFKKLSGLPHPNKRGEISFTISSKIGTFLYTSIFDSLAVAGEDERGLFVDFGGIRFYSNFEVYSIKGKSSWQLITSGTGYYDAQSPGTGNFGFVNLVNYPYEKDGITYRIMFRVSRFTLVYMLFYNNGEYRPKVSPFVSPVYIEPVPWNVWKPDNMEFYQALTSSKQVRQLWSLLHAENLLPRGSMSYETYLARSQNSISKGIKLDFSLIDNLPTDLANLKAMSQAEDLSFMEQVREEKESLSIKAEAY